MHSGGKRKCSRRVRNFRYSIYARRVTFGYTPADKACMRKGLDCEKDKRNLSDRDIVMTAHFLLLNLSWLLHFPCDAFDPYSREPLVHQSPC